MPVTKTCQQCGCEFKIPPRRSELVKYCSRECKHAAGRTTCTCEVCKKTFEYVISDAKKPKKYCSNECRIIGSRGKPLVRKNSGITVKNCKVCGSEFKVTLTRRETAKYCSKKCQHGDPDFRRACSESQQGSKSSRWNGGKYVNREGYVRKKRNVLSRQIIEWEHRTVLFKAMLEQCPDHAFIIEVDGEKMLDPKIDVHHIDRNKLNNDLSNLLAITKQAHGSLHRRGRKPDPWECWPPNPEKF